MALEDQFNLNNTTNKQGTQHTMTALEMNVLGAYGAIKSGTPKAEALKKYKLTEKVYDDNIKRCMNL